MPEKGCQPPGDRRGGFLLRAFLSGLARLHPRAPSRLDRCHCEARSAEAIHNLDCFAPLAMTGKTAM
jgi:hypothetical protein